MTRTILAGILTLAAGAAALMGQAKMPAPKSLKSDWISDTTLPAPSATVR